jgi:hypothetical protein
MENLPGLDSAAAVWDGQWAISLAHTGNNESASKSALAMLDSLLVKDPIVANNNPPQQDALIRGGWTESEKP